MAEYLLYKLEMIANLSVTRGAIVLSKSATPSRIKNNFDVIQLSPEEVAALETFAEKHGGTRRFVDPPWGRNIGFTDGLAERKASQVNS